MIALGLENAERNVLPTLNNLLENREMSLDDGRFLMPKPANWTGEPDKKLVFVHENFRVIGLSVPVPSYAGRALDPPLRSRFQCRFIDEYPSDYLLSITDTSNVSRANILSLVQFYESLRTLRDTSIQEDTTLASLPLFSQEAFSQSLAFLRTFPAMTPLEVVSRFVPAVSWMADVLPERFSHPMEQAALCLESGGAEGSSNVKNKKGGKKRKGSQSSSSVPFFGSAVNSKYDLTAISATPSHAAESINSSTVTVTFTPSGTVTGTFTQPGDIHLPACSGTSESESLGQMSGSGTARDVLAESKLLPRQRQVMGAMAMDHAMDKHLCLLGPKV